MNQRAVLAAAVRGLSVMGISALLWAGWQAAGGPRELPAPPSVRVAKLAPGDFMLVAAPLLPEGAREPLKLLVLREPGGLVRGFYLPIDEGRAAVPVSGALLRGVPCEDFAPDFTTGDIGCRQARPGFEFALRSRWSLDGRPLSAHLPPLLPAQGREVDGDWLLQ
ncbi:MAG: hypothetical protein LBQ32_11945 [Burkholderiaceae bacterium]|jgi:hypothetical protein|nr:hypothetical protein [Burkholderiaceae bacterium]